MKNKILIIFVLLFCGCYNYRELNTLAITSAVGIDKDGENYKVTVQIVNTQKIGSDTNSVGNQTKFLTFSSSGKTVQEAIRNIISESPRRLYTNHVELLIIGEDLAKEGIYNILDLFFRDPESRKQYAVIVSKESTAEDVLSIITPLETLNSKNILDSIRADSEYEGINSLVTFEQLMDMYLNQRTEISIPSIEIIGDIKKGEENENLEESSVNTKVSLSGMAVFKDDKLVGYLDKDESKTVTFIKNEIQNTLITHKCGDNKFFTVEIMDSKTDIKSDKYNIDINVTSEGNINEITCNYDLKKINDIKKIEEETNKEITELLKKSIDNIISKYNSDIFGFYDLIYKSDPKFYEKEIIELSKLKINVKAKVILQGKGNILGVIPNE